MKRSASETGLIRLRGLVHRKKKNVNWVSKQSDRVPLRQNRGKSTNTMERYCTGYAPFRTVRKVHDDTI